MAGEGKEQTCTKTQWFMSPLHDTASPKSRAAETAESRKDSPPLDTQPDTRSTGTGFLQDRKQDA